MFKEFISKKPDNDKVLILRHDVDNKPSNSLNKAFLENKLGISSTYYFRIVPESFNENIIKRIAHLGHEIGFHYEDLTLAKGNFEKAIILFKQNLEKLNLLTPIKTICMHGSPMSKWNNLDIWKNYNYKAYGIIGEPNIDLNFDEYFYLTDTGMAWNLGKYAIRDIKQSQFNIKINSTNDILEKIKVNSFPEKVMLNTHPQRWSDNNFEWMWEKSSQSIKNQIKRMIKKTITRANNVN